MKTPKNRFFNSTILMVLALALVAAGCGGSDDSTDPVDGNAADVINGNCRINKVDFPSQDETYEYEYDSKKRVTKEKYLEDGVVESYITLEYSTGKMVYKSFYNNQLEEEITYNLNGDGFVSSAEYSYSYTSSGITYKEEWKATYTYNADKYLTKAQSESKTTSSGTTVSTNSSIADFTYSNGNLVKIVETDTYDDSDYNSTTTQEYQYGTKEAKGGFYVNRDNIDVLTSSGLLGRMSKNLPTMYSSKEKYSGGFFNVFYEYTYQFNADGYVTGISSTYDYESGRKGIVDGRMVSGKRFGLCGLPNTRSGARTASEFSATIGYTCQ